MSRSRVASIKASPMVLDGGASIGLWSLLQPPPAPCWRIGHVPPRRGSRSPSSARNSTAALTALTALSLLGQQIVVEVELRVLHDQRDYCKYRVLATNVDQYCDVAFVFA
ncbi:MAG: hypothetical protein ACREYE_21345 [Gammaproteobacteria bacterium]